MSIFDNPARQSFITDIADEDQLLNAVALNNVAMNVARILGAAAGGGAVATLGLSACFDINAASFVAVLVMLALMRTAELRPTARTPRKRGQVRVGFRYVRQAPELAIPLMMIALAGALAWEFQVSLPLIAHATFHGGAGTYAIMTVIMGMGAVIGGIVSVSRASSRLRTLAVASIGWGAAICLAALSPTVVTIYIVLVFVGYGSITFNSLAKTTLQLASAPEYAGTGNGPVGDRLAGVHTDRWPDRRLDRRTPRGEVGAAGRRRTNPRHGSSSTPNSHPLGPLPPSRASH